MPVILSRKGGGSSGGGAPSGPAGGDLAGTYPNPTIDSGASPSGDVLTSDGAGGTAFLPSAGGLFDAYAYLREEQANNTDGGTFTQGAWQTRVLNTEVFDADAIVSLAANQFTLAAGTYYIEARAPCFDVLFHKLKIANITDTTDAVIGMSCHCVAGGGGWGTVGGRITIAASKAFALQHRCSATQATNGLGTLTNFGVIEVFAEVFIWREAA